MVTTIHGFSVAADPARLPGGHERLRVDLGRRPLAGPRLRRHGPPRHRPRRYCPSRPPAARSSCASAGSTPTRAPHDAIDDRRAAPDAGSCSAARCRTRATSARGSAPHIDGDARPLPRLGGPGRARPRCLAGAACLLHPIAFEEPFGLSVVEAMVCGTPVVAYPRGSMPELVEDGVTGVLADGVAGRGGGRRAGRGARPRRLPPRGGASVSARGRMVDAYVEVYEALLGAQQRVALHPAPRQPAAVARALALPDQRRDERRRDAGRRRDGARCAAPRTAAASPISPCARSHDGVSNWVVDEQPALAYDGDHAEEEWGLEDARVTRVDELDAWIITYTAFGPGGPGISLARTSDFRTLRAAGHGDGPRGQERSTAPAPRGRPLDPVPPPDLDPRSRHLALPLHGPQELEHPRARAGPPARGLVGLGPHGYGRAAAGDGEGWLVVYHGVRADGGRRSLPRGPRAARPRAARRGCCAARTSGC